MAHLLVDMWDTVCRALEDARASINITAVDYAKAFNRLSFQHCLEAFARKGASTELIQILATFLSNRTMSVRVNNTWSDPPPGVWRRPPRIHTWRTTRMNTTGSSPTPPATRNT